MDKGSEISKSFAKEVVSVMAENALGKLSLGLLNGAVKARNQRNADELIRRLKLGKIEITDELIQSDEFLGYTTKILLAITTATKQKKVDYLLNVYIEGISDDSFYDKSEKFNELIDIISSLSLESIAILIETYKFHTTSEEISMKNIYEHMKNIFSMPEEEILATWYLLSGKGLIEQQPIYGKGFVPYPSFWLRDIIHILEVENQFQ